jgi:RES domain-containing protein
MATTCRLPSWSPCSKRPPSRSSPVPSGVSRVSVAGSWWRQTPYGPDPLWLASPPSGGRWQRGDGIAAIYLADEESTAWGRVVPIARGDRTTTHPWHAPRPMAVDDRRQRCRRPLHPSQARTGRFAHSPPNSGDLGTIPSSRGDSAHQGHRGILYPSAARPDHQALCPFPRECPNQHRPVRHHHPRGRSYVCDSTRALRQGQHPPPLT